METTTANTATAPEFDTDQTQAQRPAQARQLRRSSGDKMLGGVAGGLARYLDVDVTLVRVVIAAASLFTGTVAALYIAAWLLIPADGEDQSIAAAWIARRREYSR